MLIYGEYNNNYSRMGIIYRYVNRVFSQLFLTKIISEFGTLLTRSSILGACNFPQKRIFMTNDKVFFQSKKETKTIICQRLSELTRNITAQSEFVSDVKRTSVDLAS